MTNLIGMSVGRYRIIEKLGEGGMATVYRAFDSRLERDVAVKVIRRDAFSQEMIDRVLKRFEREAKTLAKLNHPNIVDIIDYGEFEGNPYLVMPYMPGGTLKSRLGRAMDWQEAVRLLRPIATALAYAHEMGVIHRDIKPANILITASGEPKLTDFGIAKILEVQEGQTLTGTGVGIGTPEYMAPEQGMGHEIDARADIYSLGVVFYELVTGRKPFIADTPMAVVVKHLNDPLPRPSEFVTDLSEEVERIIYKTMAKDPTDRYQSMNGVISAFKALERAQVTPLKFDTHRKPEPEVKETETLDTVEDFTNASKSKVVPEKHTTFRIEDGSPDKQQKKWKPWQVVAIASAGIAVLALIIGQASGWFVSPATPTALATDATTVLLETSAPVSASSPTATSTIPTIPTDTFTPIGQTVSGEIVKTIKCRKGPSSMLYTYDEFIDPQQVIVLGKNSDETWIYFETIDNQTNCWTIKENLIFSEDFATLPKYPDPVVSGTIYYGLAIAYCGDGFSGDLCLSMPNCYYLYYDNYKNIYFTSSEDAINYWNRERNYRGGAKLLNTFRFTKEAADQSVKYFTCPVTINDGSYTIIH